MKAFKQYLVESNKTYQYRIKLADCEVDSAIIDALERGLAQFDLLDLTKPKSLPISRSMDFPKLGPVSRCIFDVTLNYPTNSVGLRQVVHASTRIPLDHIIVTTALEDDMEKYPVSQHEDGPVLGNPEYPDNKGAQDVVGLKRVESLLKELGKDKHALEQYKGVNDEILAKSAPSEKAAKTTSNAKQGTISPVGSRQNKIPSPVKGR